MILNVVVLIIELLWHIFLIMVNGMILLLNLCYFHQSHLKGRQDYGIKSKLSDYAQKLNENNQFFHLVTVKEHQYYVHHYEGKVNKLGNAVVLISYPKEAFGNPNALRAFLCTNVGLETQDILERYTSRWPIEIFFRQSKGKLAFDKYQISSILSVRPGVCHPTSFRFHLTMDTLIIGCKFTLSGHFTDFYRLDYAHAG